MLKKAAFMLLSVVAIVSCNQVDNQKTSEQESNQESKLVLYSSECITEAEVVEAQEEWGAGIVKIGKVYSEGGNYKLAATEHIQNLYGYDLGLVLFKPTLASVEQFRGTFDAALF